MSKHNRSFAVWLLTLALAVLALFQDRPWKSLEVFDFDQGGYYVYLPSAFIYHDLGRADSLQHSAEVRKPERQRSMGLKHLPNGNVISKYPLGLALGQVPWFWGAHLYTQLKGGRPDGFSLPYQQSVMLSGLAYGLLGLWLLRKLLLRYFDDATTAWALAGIGLGTNFFVYATYDAGMSHAPLFMLQAALLYCTARWYETFRPNWAAGMGLFLGLAVLARHTEALYVLVPLCWGLTSGAALRQRAGLLLRHAGQLAVAAAIGLAVLSLQLLFWRVTSGHWVVDSYGEEGFDFLHPHILDGLLSVKKGWLLFTPLAAVALLGLVAARRFVPAAVAPVLVLVPVLIYVTFSWWDWAYGGGFSARPLVSLYPLLALPLASLVAWARENTRWRAVVQVVLVLGIVLNLWQSWQYAAGVFYPIDTWPEYRRNFFHHRPLPDQF